MGFNHFKFCLKKIEALHVLHLISPAAFSCSRDMLIKFLDDHCMRENGRGNGNVEGNVFAFDCVYLPMDFRYYFKFQTLF